MKRLLLLSAATLLIVVLAVVLVAGLHRVAPNELGLRVLSDGTTQPYSPGTYFIPPFSGKFVSYPRGQILLRFPTSGAFEATLANGTGVRVALSIRAETQDDSAPYIFRSLGADIATSLEEKAREVIEIQTAHFNADGDATPQGFEAAVIEDLTPIFGNARILLTAYRVEEWTVDADHPVVVPAKPLRKVVLVGIDGADWVIIDDLIARGQLPNFRRLKEEGATGPLRSIEPMLSPLLWTTMATGKLPEEHGILNFTVADPKTGARVPVSRLYRKVDAFWNMLSDYGRSVDIVGWLATFPAEPINGIMVTDRLGYLAYAGAGASGEAIAGSVSPAEKLGDITDLVVESRSVQWEDFRGFAHVDRQTFVKNRELPFDPKNPINNLIMLYASTVTYDRIAERLADDRPDFLAVYFELLDATGHLFMHYAPPQQPEIDDASYAMYKDAIDRAYAVQDSILGRFIDRLDDETVLMVVSDHGFKSGDSRPKLRPEIWAGKAAMWHRIDGVVCFFGNGIRRGVEISGASILDIAPTILALQGLPWPVDMSGTVLEAAFDNDLAASLNRVSVPTLQRKREIDELAQSTGDATTEAALKKLEALGYITSESPDAYNNLGQRLQEQGKYVEAIAEFKKALAINPNFPAALNNMGVCYGKLRRYDEAEGTLKRAIELNPENVFAMNNLAVMYMETGRFDNARAVSRRSIEVDPNYANGHLTLGAVYANMGDLALAESEFVRALEIDPGNRSAHDNLEKLRAQMQPDG